MVDVTAWDVKVDKPDGNYNTVIHLPLLLEELWLMWFIWVLTTSRPSMAVFRTVQAMFLEQTQLGFASAVLIVAFC